MKTILVNVVSSGTNVLFFLGEAFCFVVLTIMSMINFMFPSVVHVKSKENKRRAWSV